MAVVINGTTGVTTPTESVATTIGVGGATPSASGAGITFPATQSASTDANTLDDYEEGTWTPTLTFGGASTGITYQTNGRQGTYVKIGKLVTATCYVYTSSTGSETGTMRVAGLPFAAAPSSPYYMDYYFPYGARAGYTLPSGAIPMAYLGGGGSQYEFYYTVVTTGAAPINITKSLVSGGILEISVQFSYTTA